MRESFCTLHQFLLECPVFLREVQAGCCNLLQDALLLHICSIETWLAATVGSFSPAEMMMLGVSRCTGFAADFAYLAGMKKIHNSLLVAVVSMAVGSFV